MRITDEYGNNYTVSETPMSAGGQGAVFKIEENPKLLLKAIVTPENKIIKNEKKYIRFEDSVIQVAALGNIKNVAQPLCLLESPNCGYIMRLMQNMQAIEEIMIPREMKNDIAKHFDITGGLSKRLLILKNLAKILNDLYLKGIVYCDISPKNVFVSKDVESYETWLIDVDNMNYETDSKLCIGTPCYMAPEVYMGNKNTMKSDVYSFALLAYELLTYSKPFEGKAMNDGDDDGWDDDWNDDWDSDSENLSFDEKVSRGLMPWVLQKDDTSNERIKGMGIPPEYVMTERMLELFDQTFSTGRNNPQKRPTMSQWYYALSEACDSVMTCTKGHSYFGKRCLLCNEKSDYYIAKSYCVSVIEDEENQIYEEAEELSYQQSFKYKRGEIKNLSNGLISDEPEKFTFSCLTVQEKNKGNVNVTAKTDSVRIKLQNPDVKNLEDTVINVKKGNDTVKRIKFKKVENNEI